MFIGNYKIEYAPLGAAWSQRSRLQAYQRAGKKQGWLKVSKGGRRGPHNGPPPRVLVTPAWRAMSGTRPSPSRPYRAGKAYRTTSKAPAYAFSIEQRYVETRKPTKYSSDSGYCIDVIVVDKFAPMDGARFTITRQGPAAVVLKITRAGERLGAFTFPNLLLAYELASALTNSNLLWVRSRGRGFGKAADRAPRRKKKRAKSKPDQPRELGNSPRSIVAGITLGSHAQDVAR